MTSFSLLFQAEVLDGKALDIESSSEYGEKKIIHSDMQLACTCVYVAWVKRRAGKISDENLKSVSPSKRIITQNDSQIFTVKFQHPYQSLIDLA